LLDSLLKEMSSKIKLANGDEVGAPKTNRASKKNKKSWRKNVDMAQVNEFLEEKRFEERTGGSMEDKPDEALFTLDTNVEVQVSSRNKRRESKPLKCFALLEGLPGAPDPVPVRNKTRKPEERENPIVTKMRNRKIKEGKIQKKYLERTRDRQRQLAKKEMSQKEAKTRRRTKFDFDLWAGERDPAEEQKKKLPSEDWVSEDAMIQTSLGTGQYTPKYSKFRSVSTATKLPSVEVPEPGASYNPSLEDHQDLLWRAAVVEIEKEKDQRRLERQTTAMYPSKDQAPTSASIMKEMSEGIVEFGDDKETTVEELGEDDIEKVVVGNKPKTRRQKRDRRKRMFEDQRKERERSVRLRETEISRLRSIRKELNSEESRIEKNMEKKKIDAEKKTTRTSEAFQLQV